MLKTKSKILNRLRYVKKMTILIERMNKEKVSPIVAKCMKIAHKVLQKRKNPRQF